MRLRSKVGIERLDWLAASLLAVLLAVGVFFQFYRLGALNFWIDEIWIAVASDPALPLGNWLRDWVLTDVHPPLYMLLLRPWRLVFGGDEFALRLFSAVATAGAVAAILVLHRWEPVVRRPLALAAWFACSLVVIRYAHEARSYAFLLALTMVATLIAVAIAQRMDRGEPVLRPALALAAVTVVSGYAHYFGILVGAGLFGALVVFAACWHRRYLAVIFATGIGAVAVLLPWIIFHAVNLSDKLGGGFWIANRWNYAAREVAGQIAGSPGAFLLVAVALALLLALRPRVLRKPAVGIPLVAMGLMVVGGMAISLHTPIITGRNLMILVPPFYVATIAALADLSDAKHAGWRTVGTLAPVLLAATSLSFAVERITTLDKQRWREAAEQVASLPGCRDATLQVSYWPEEIYAYYLPQRERYHVRTVETQSGVLRLKRPEGRCPLILWSGPRAGLVPTVSDQLGLEPERIVLWETKGHMLMLDRSRLPASWKDGPGSRGPTAGHAARSGSHPFRAALDGRDAGT